MKPNTRREREIWEACDALFTQVNHVKEITGDKIMNKLLNLGYKKGCANEIYKYRRTWWQLRGISEDEVKGISISNPQASNSSSFSDPIAKAVSIVQDELKQEAQTKISQIELELKQIISLLESKIANLENKNQELETDKTNLTANIEALNKENAEIRAKANGLDAEILKVRSLLAEVKTEKILDLETYQGSLENLANNLDDNRQQYIYETNRLQSELSKNKITINELSQELCTIRADLEKAMGENIILRNKCYNYESENAKLLDHVDSQERLLEQSSDIYRNIIRKMHNKEELIHKQNHKIDLIGENLTKILSKYLEVIEVEQ